MNDKTMTDTKKKSSKKLTSEPTPAVAAEQPQETRAEPQHTAEEKKEIQVIERIIENKAVAPTDAFGKLTRSQIDLLKRTIARGASDEELNMFIQVCKGANLNPFLKQVHLVPRWDTRESREVRTIQVGIDGFRAVAESSGQYAGNDDPIYEGDKEIEYGKDKKKVNVPLKATVTVYKMMEGQRQPFTATARWDEYYPGDKMGFQWHIRPYLMLGKCAEALALRKAFPKLLSGMYAQEEMDRTAQVESDDQRMQKAFTRLMSAINSSSEQELMEYRKKMEASDKYTPEQKKQSLDAIDKRLAELAPKDVPVEEQK